MKTISDHLRDRRAERRAELSRRFIAATIGIALALLIGHTVLKAARIAAETDACVSDVCATDLK